MLYKCFVFAGIGSYIKISQIVGLKAKSALINITHVVAQSIVQVLIMT